MKPRPLTDRGRGRGGQQGYEPPSQIRARELRVMGLAAQGWSQREIAADVGISQPAVCKILHRVEARVIGELTATVERQKVRQTLRLEHLYTEAVRAWEASKGEITRRRQRKVTDGSPGEGTTVVEVTVENRYGDPRFLDLGRRVLADLRALWGLDAPQKVDLRATRNPYEDLSEDELDAGDAEADAGGGRVCRPVSAATGPRRWSDLRARLVALL